MASIKFTKSKLAFSSLAVLFISAAMKVMGPLVANFWFLQAQLMWSSFSLWVRPPLVNIVVNCIIVVLVVSSRFKHEHEEGKVKTLKKAASIDDDPGVFYETMKLSKTGKIEVAVAPPTLDTPLVSSSVKQCKVMKCESSETLEDTWKAITEGRAPPPTRHLKRTESALERQKERVDLGETGVRKANTFRDRMNQQSLECPPLGMMTDQSLSKDELNMRVEAFIKNFNEELRIQRQESLKRYLQKIKGEFSKL